MRIKNFLIIAVLLLSGMAACQKEEVEQPESSVTSVQNSYANRMISQKGQTISVSFVAKDSWTAELKFKTDGEDWAMFQNSDEGEGQKNSRLMIKFTQNDEESTREVELWINVNGFEAEKLATFTQAALGERADAAINKALNEYMNAILEKEYLWAKEYKMKGVDLTVPYNEFLSKHLLSLGDVNIEDGGYYKAVQANAGQRYIYSNISEIQYVTASKAATKAFYTSGLGFGPFLSSALSDIEDVNVMGIAPSYVRRGSPAEAAGLRRGDIIYKVNNVELNKVNYQIYMRNLYYSPSGTYSFEFLRFEKNADGKYELKEHRAEVTTEAYIYDPVLHLSILEDEDNPNLKIGYLVYESFETSAHEFLTDAVRQLAEAGINKLILDLRFNVGGAVAQSRWLSGCIAGKGNKDKTFAQVIYNDGKQENWKFEYGYSSDTDNLGVPDYLSIDKVYVIGSYNTASASELLINSLRGIDFPLVLVGSQTEGKNVGMTVTETSYENRRFQFAPVTFWVKNAKGWGDYKDGLKADEGMVVNNDNTDTTDDADNVFPYSFSDWGNMDYNIALQWAYCDITGKARWNNVAKTKSLSDATTLCPVEFQPLSAPMGRYGNLIYR